MKEFFKERKIDILLSIIVIFISYGWNIFTTNIRIDSELLMINPGSNHVWLQIGRFGLVFLKYVFNLQVYNAFRMGIMSIFFLWFSCIILLYGMYKINCFNSIFPYWIFVILFCSSPIWSYQFYFILQEAEIMIAMCMVSISVVGIFLLKTQDIKKIALFYVGAIILLVISFGTYQSFVLYYISACLLFFSIYTLGNVQNGDKSCGGGICCSNNSYICYSFCDI